MDWSTVFDDTATVGWPTVQKFVRVGGKRKQKKREKSENKSEEEEVKIEEAEKFGPKNICYEILPECLLEGVYDLVSPDTKNNLGNRIQLEKRIYAVQACM